MTQILVEGAADDGLIGVAQLARKKGHRVDVENGGLLINVLGRHRWQSHD